MHNRIPPTLKISLLATAVITLSGCSLPQQRSDIGENIVNAGTIAASVTSRAYDKTISVLGFKNNDEPEFDEVDMALIDAEKSSNARLQIPGVGEIEPPPSGAPAIATIPAIDPTDIPVATIDYNHTVGPNETMWTIAKLTTGNANNWRILTEINQLDLNSPMRIGQEILIPADLVLPQIVANDGLMIEPNNGAITEETSALAQIDDSDAARLDLDNIRPITLADLESDPINPDADSELTLGASDSTVSESLEQAEDLLAELDGTDLDSAEPEAAAAILDPTFNAVALKADVGETLWDMAKRTTGDATNWEAIAAHNGFTEKDIGRIRYGQTIYVPVDMAKTELGGDKIVAAPAADAVSDIDADADATNQLVAQTTADPAAGLAPNSDAEAIDATANLVANASGIMDETQEIKIVEAAYQPTDVEQILSPEVTAAGESSETIMVSGTYYPKAVYNEADFSSSLLMRVSPGTQMTVTRAMGPWYEVQTEHGMGYMHSRDIK